MLALSNTRACTTNRATTTRATTQAQSTAIHAAFSKSKRSSLSCQLRSCQGSVRSLSTSGAKRRVTSVASTVSELAPDAVVDNGNVEEIQSPEQFYDALKRAGDKMVVLDISTKTCGPCKFVYPHFVQMSKDQEDVVFLKIFGDLSLDTRNLMKEWGIRSVPQFHFYLKEEKIDSHGGANPDSLKEKVAEVKSSVKANC